MGVWHVILGVGTILFISMYWVTFTHVTDMLADAFSIGASAVTLPEYTLTSKIMYYSLLFMGIIIFAWILKESSREQDRNPYA